jgi:hypothetical protein
MVIKHNNKIFSTVAVTRFGRRRGLVLRKAALVLHALLFVLVRGVYSVVDADGCGGGFARLQRPHSSLSVPNARAETVVP